MSDEVTNIISSADQVTPDKPESMETEVSDETFRPMVERLLMDIEPGHASVLMEMSVSYDPYTGEDLRGRSNEAKCRLLLPVAEKDMADRLSLPGWDCNTDVHFDHSTGERVPPKFIEVTLEDGRVEKQVSLPNCEARLAVWHRMAEEHVNIYISKGGSVPSFDSKTGVEIPRGSLRALAYAKPKGDYSSWVQGETLEQRRNREQEEDRRDAELGMDLLAKLKERKRTQQS